MGFNIKDNKPKRNGKYIQGLYKPSNPQKYSGDINEIIYRSSWEFDFCKYCDAHSEIITWSSETVKVKYFHPIKQKYCTYYPDFWIIVRNGNIDKKYLIEIKPYSQTNAPVIKEGATYKQKKRYIQEMQLWQINVNKWMSAQEYCKLHNAEFLIITERFLYKK